jgi:starch synthase
VITIHNLAFQGQMPSTLLARLGLPPEAYATEGVEYYQSIGYLKAALWASDRITTVSPSYAREICTESGGMGASGILSARAADVHGILNGIDTASWDPATDTLIEATYSLPEMTRRAANKAALQARFGLTRDNSLLFGVISRLTWLKGIDLLLQTLPTVLAAGAQLVVLGEGDRDLSEALLDSARAAPGRIGVQIGYDEALAHRIQAGSDALLVPSRFEPCGLTQLYALRYGALPVVARVGGLADSVIDANEMALAAGVATGVQFAPVDAEMLGFAIRRTAALWQDGASWAKTQANAMATDVGWARSARCYAALYRAIAPVSKAPAAEAITPLPEPVPAPKARPGKRAAPKTPVPVTPPEPAPEPKVKVRPAKASATSPRTKSQSKGRA